MNTVRKLLPVAVIGIALVLTVVLISTRPQPAVEPARESSETVAVQPVSRRLEPLLIEAQGRVIAAREVSVNPQVSGKVTETNPQLVPGGIIAAGEVLFVVEDIDYRLAVEQARTRLAEAQAALALEQGRQAIAKREYALFAEDLPPEQDSALALREPQLRAADAAVAAARAQLRQANVSLSRTRVTAPFNAIVRAESIDLGQIVSPQTQAARLTGTDTFWVQVSVPVADLPYIDIATADRPGSRVTVSYDTGRTTLEREGQVVRLLSDLDAAGQMARVLVEVDDPLALSGDGARLLLESFVSARIRVDRDVEVVTLPRRYLHNGNEVYVYNDGVLDIRQVDVVWRRTDAVLIGDGLRDGDAVITSSLASPVAGMKLQVEERTGVASVAGEAQ